MSKTGYPVWWDTTITIYNKYIDAQTQIVRWYRTVVTDCFWNLDGSTVKVGDVTLNSKSIICRIPKDIRFLEKRDWLNTPNDEMNSYFTLGQGDIIVKGEVNDVIDEYTSGYRSTDLLNKYKGYQECMEVNDYAINTGTGRNNEHYLARGN